MKNKKDWLWIKVKIFEFNNYECAVCGKPAKDLAHCIAKSKVNLRKYGSWKVHHWNNLIPVCDLQCNAKCNIDNNPHKVKIILSLTDKEKMKASDILKELNR